MNYCSFILSFSKFIKAFSLKNIERFVQYSCPSINIQIHTHIYVLSIKVSSLFRTNVRMFEIVTKLWCGHK